MHYDSDLYHAQSIHWIETYGAVKGLANLHNRLGYNSAAFALTALYSFSFTNQSYHAVQGFCYFLLLLVSLQGLFGKDRARMPLPYRFLYLAALFYLATVSNEIVSPASDCFMVLLAFLILLFFLQEGIRAKDVEALAGRICILFPGIVFLVTVKLSAAGLLLIGLLPLVYCIRHRKGKQILACFLVSLLTSAPFLIRNIILTGYLFYPVPSLDLFSVAWKVPTGQAAYDALEIRAYTDRSFTENWDVFGKAPGWLLRPSLTLPQPFLQGVVAACRCIVANQSISGRPQRQGRHVCGISGTKAKVQGKNRGLILPCLSEMDFLACPPHCGKQLAGQKLENFSDNQLCQESGGRIEAAARGEMASRKN